MEHDVHLSLTETEKNDLVEYLKSLEIEEGAVVDAKPWTYLHSPIFWAMMISAPILWALVIYLMYLSARLLVPGAR
ncbi:MAG TPA: hypothetical protein VFS34_03130 [Thermoanaerobaculia bacterium]|nr:hypothetical protein [Thermoanaerobaculia bacterium]